MNTSHSQLTARLMGKSLASKSLLILTATSYIKLVPIRPYDDKYNLSVWFINLKGIDDEERVTQCIQGYGRKKEMNAMKQLVKLSRQFFKTKFEDEEIIRKIEHPLVTSLYSSVLNGEFYECLQMFNIFHQEGFYSNYLRQQPIRIVYKRLDVIEKEITEASNRLKHNFEIERKKGRTEVEQINSIANHMTEMEVELDLDINSLSDSNFLMEGIENSLNEHLDLIWDTKGNDYPCVRGGHSMTLDEEHGIIYLYGGWDGKKDLDDLWSYEINKNFWKLIKPSGQAPGPRSCHRMIFDRTGNRLLLYGKFGVSTDKELESHFYEYDLTKSKWGKLEIKQEFKNGKLIKGNGPGQVYNHQMVIDNKTQTVYLFGGTLVKFANNDTEERYLSLWRVNLRKMFWENLNMTSNKDKYEMKLKSRNGHSLLIDQKDRELIIIGGSRGYKRSTSSIFDMVRFNIDDKIIEEIFHDYSKCKNAPKVHFSFCSVNNSTENEVFIFGGLSKNDKSDSISNSFWVFNKAIKRWTRASPCSNSLGYEGIMQSLHQRNCVSPSIMEPLPRYASTMVYSEKLKRGWIFGGNPNIKNSNPERLNDFWSYELKRLTSSEIKKLLTYKVLRHFYLELCMQKDFQKALDLLTNRLTPLMTDNTDEIKELSKYLILYDGRISKDPLTDLRGERLKLFEELVQYINDTNEDGEMLNR